MTPVFFFKQNHYCGACVVEVLVAAGLAPSSVKDKSTDIVLAQVAETRGIDVVSPESFTSFGFPKAVYPVPADLLCEGCGCHLADAELTTSRLDTLATDLTRQLLASWSVADSPTEGCRDLVVLRALRDAVDACMTRFAHNALIAGEPLHLVALACELSTSELETTWHRWATLQIQRRDSYGRPALSLDEFHQVLGVFTRR